jgi:carbonic anhydrase
MNEKPTPEPTTDINLPRRLFDGYRAFRAGRLPTEQSRYRELAERGQAPETMVVGCCDSRVSPEVIFDAGPGELFVVRNVANLVPPYSPGGLYHGVSAALEYGVAVLRVKHLVVLGHARCGGIQAFASNAPTGDFIGKWISLLAPAAASIQNHREESDYLKRLEQTSLKRSLDNLKTFPFIRAASERNTLALFGAYFDVATGELSVLAQESGRFVVVARD